MKHTNFRRRVWIKASEAADLQGVHFHDLRHAGNMLTAEAGATLRELMDRMGHSSTRAALIYLHATSQRQRTIADAVGDITRAALQESQDRPGSPPSGTDVAHSSEGPPENQRNRDPWASRLTWRFAAEWARFDARVSCPTGCFASSLPLWTRTTANPGEAGAGSGRATREPGRT